MKILVAEDEPNISRLYQISFEDADHEVTLTNNGFDCLEQYYKSLKESERKEDTSDAFIKKTPFDVVILDYRMPKKDGMEVAREILAIRPNQRIIFVSAFVLDTLNDAVKNLDRVVEMVQKPFEIEELMSLIEDTEIWRGLEEMNVNVPALREMGVSHLQIQGLFEGLKKLQKGKGFTVRSQ
jgi:DNA-binding response OmpR family regulator